MTDFSLEERYIVIKLKDLTEDQRSRLESRMDNNDIIPVQQALVLESDWPEFGPALKLLEDRVNGKTLEEPITQISWASVEPWFLQNEQMLKDVGKFEGLKGVALEVWRAAKSV